MSEDVQDSGSSKARAQLQKIDDQIVAYNRKMSKERWIHIDRHWQARAERRRHLMIKVRELFTQSELDDLGLY
jgi:hypothetical protein